MGLFKKGRNSSSPRAFFFQVSNGTKNGLFLGCIVEKMVFEVWGLGYVSMFFRRISLLLGLGNCGILVARQMPTKRRTKTDKTAKSVSWLRSDSRTWAFFWCHATSHAAWHAGMPHAAWLYGRVVWNITQNAPNVWIIYLHFLRWNMATWNKGENGLVHLPIPWVASGVFQAFLVWNHHLIWAAELLHKKLRV